MKNNLNNEEKLLRDKLNQAESGFNYQESSWKEMQQLIQKKGFFVQYASIVKAGIGFVFILATVYLINSNWSESKPLTKSQSKQAVVVEQNSTTEQIKNTTQAEEITQPSMESNSTETVPELVAEESPKTNADNEQTEKVEHSQLTTNQVVETVITNETPKIEANNQANTKLEYKLFGINIEGSTCIGNTISLSANTNGENTKLISYIWKVNNKTLKSTSNSIEFKVEQAGTQRIQLIAIQDGLTLTQESLKLTVNEPIEINFSYLDLQDPYNDLTVKFSAITEGLSNYEWKIQEAKSNLSGQETSYSFERKGVFDVELSHTTKEGCISKIKKPVAVELDFRPFAPTDFTPNGDDINGTFIPVGFTPEAGIIKDDKFRMSIYDYNGKLVYTTTSNRDAWNGRLNNQGNVLAEGVYVWKVELENNKGQQASYAGKIRIRY